MTTPRTHTATRVRGRVGRRTVSVIAGLTVILVVGAGCLPRVLTPRPPGPKTSAFLDSGDFDGALKRRVTNTQWGGEAIYLGRIIFTNLNRSIVEDVLDAIPSSDLELAPNKSATPNVHPVILLIGDQTQTSLVFPWWYPSIGTDYSELILMIPFVRKIGGGGNWHSYVVRIYLDDFWALVIGNSYYGLRKEQALLPKTSSDLDVYRKADHVFHAAFAANGPWLPDTVAEANLPNYQDAKDILEMPVIGTLSQFPGEPYVCTYFEFHTDQAEVRPMTSDHAFLKEFGPGMSGWVSLGVVTSVDKGAFEIKAVKWRMGFPPIGCNF